MLLSKSVFLISLHNVFLLTQEISHLILLIYQRKRPFVECSLLGKST